VTGTTAVPDRRPVILEELLQPYTDRGTGRSLIEKWLITREEFIEKVSLAVLNDPNSPPSLPELTLGILRPLVGLCGICRKYGRESRGGSLGKFNHKSIKMLGT
jgi:hypothetical protein